MPCVYWKQVENGRFFFVFLAYFAVKSFSNRKGRNEQFHAVCGNRRQNTGVFPLDSSVNVIYTVPSMEHSTTAHSMTAMANRGILALEDGRCFHGISVGHEGIAAGEAVFNTATMGYQEIITDPSYAGQIVVMTTPQIGNTGINPEDNESEIKPLMKGLLMREISTRTSNWRATESLSDFLKRRQIVALSEIDTRSLTQHLRSHGTKRAVIASGDWNPDELIRKAKESPRLEEIDILEPLTVSQSLELPEPDDTKKIVVFDFGLKRSVLHAWASRGAKMVILPAHTSAEDVLKMQPDAVLLSNGPGDPARLGSVSAEIAKLMGKVPIAGMALGHQLLGIALGGTTYRLPFGHYGTQPVLNRLTGRVHMTPQNHNFCLLPESLPPEVEITHINLNDGTIEGLRHKELPVYSLQFECTESWEDMMPHMA